MGKGHWRGSRGTHQKRTRNSNAEGPDTIHRDDVGDNHDQTLDKQSLGSVPATTVNKNSPRRLPKAIKGLVHIALVCAYSGTPFRGLQIQTHEHITHTVEGHILSALYKAGYLIDDDFEGGKGMELGGRLKTKGGIRIVMDTSMGANESGDGSVTCGSPLAIEEEDNNADEEMKGKNDVCRASDDEQPDSVCDGGVMMEHYRTPKSCAVNAQGSFRFMRSCRTDKGVHAVRNVVSLYLRDADWRRDGSSGMKNKINECLSLISSTSICDDVLPADHFGVVRVLSVEPVLPSFEPRMCCTQRVYRYLIPLYALGLPSMRDVISTTEDDKISTCLSTETGNKREPASVMDYFNGTCIDDWEGLFKAYPDLLRETTGVHEVKCDNKMFCFTDAMEGSHDNSLYKKPPMTPLPHPEVLLYGQAATIAAVVADCCERKKSTPVHEVPSETTTLSRSWTSEVSLIIHAANEFLHQQYVGPSVRYHNFSVNQYESAGPAAAGCHEGRAQSKYICGTDGEAPRSIHRCEIAPFVLWLDPKVGDKGKCHSQFGGGNVTFESIDQLLQTPGCKNQGVLSLRREALMQRQRQLLRDINKEKDYVSHMKYPYVVFQVEGRSFLLHMIRKMVGLLLAVLRGGRPWWIARIVNTLSSKESIYNANKQQTIIKALFQSPARFEEICKLLSPHDKNDGSGKALQLPSFLGEVKEGMVRDLMHSSCVAHVPLCPGIYLSLIHASYATYDVAVSGVRNNWAKQMIKRHRYLELKATEKSEESDQQPRDFKRNKITESVPETTSQLLPSDVVVVGDSNIITPLSEFPLVNSALPYYMSHCRPFHDAVNACPSTTSHLGVYNGQNSSSLSSSLCPFTPAQITQYALDLYVASVEDAREKIRKYHPKAYLLTNPIVYPAVPVVGAIQEDMYARDCKGVLGDGGLLIDYPVVPNPKKKAVFSNATSTTLNPTQEAESFYWNVICPDIAAGDLNLYISGDVETTLAIRDTARLVRLARQMMKNIDGNEMEDLRQSNSVAITDATLIVEVMESMCSDTPSITIMETEKTQLFDTVKELYQPLSHLLAIDRKVVTRAKLALLGYNHSFHKGQHTDLHGALDTEDHSVDATTFGCSEMTIFLRQLRVHDWHYKPSSNAVQKLGELNKHNDKHESVQENTAPTKEPKAVRRERWRKEGILECQNILKAFFERNINTPGNDQRATTQGEALLARSLEECREAFGPADSPVEDATAEEMRQRLSTCAGPSVGMSIEDVSVEILFGGEAELADRRWVTPVTSPSPQDTYTLDGDDGWLYWTAIMSGATRNLSQSSARSIKQQNSHRNLNKAANFRAMEVQAQREISTRKEYDERTSTGKSNTREDGTSMSLEIN